MFFRKSIFMTTDYKVANEAKEILDNNRIEFKQKVTDLSSVWLGGGIMGTTRNINVDKSSQLLFDFLVAPKDVEYALFLLKKLKS